MLIRLLQAAVRPLNTGHLVLMSQWDTTVIWQQWYPVGLALSEGRWHFEVDTGKLQISVCFVYLVCYYHNLYRYDWLLFRHRSWVCVTVMAIHFGTSVLINTFKCYPIGPHCRFCCRTFTQIHSIQNIIIWKEKNKLFCKYHSFYIHYFWQSNCRMLNDIVMHSDSQCASTTLPLLLLYCFCLCLCRQINTFSICISISQGLSHATFACALVSLLDIDVAVWSVLFHFCSIWCMTFVSQ